MDLKCFNGPHLVKFSKKKFADEVKHLFSGPDAKKEIDDLYALIQATYKPQNANAEIVSDNGSVKNEGDE